MIHHPKISYSVLEDQFNRDPRGTSFDCLSDNFIIIGLGGIGSHVADIIGSFCSVRRIILIDDDIVEISNLNRTAYSYKHVGKYKVEAMSEIISTRNIKPTIYPINSRFNKELCNTLNSNNLINDINFYEIFDCRDNYYGDYDLIKSLNFIRDYSLTRGAYNGMSITIDKHPEKHPVWGQGGYTETVSHSVPSRLAALLTIVYASHKSINKENDSFDKPITFDVDSLVEYLTYGVKIASNDEIKNSDIFKNAVFGNNVTKEQDM